MSQELLEHAARALRAFGATPRTVFLIRISAKAVSAMEAAEAIYTHAATATLDTPLLGWWQTTERLGHSARGDALPDALDMESLIEGEWTVGSLSIQLRRTGAQLMLASVGEADCLPEVPAPESYSHAALVQTHQLVGRKDLGAPQLTLAVYSVWDMRLQQVVPVAQRLLSIGKA